ncbi:glycosyltransferase family 1 protein [Bacillus sp. AFS073361]|uniref:glycosyltransferase family 4 protein n=1 Tax=Bacillus sp. AFS073361 TaxID=2033511 RepID=UPI000BF2CC47|nr:glycosyltransferase family 4 protein [Bacillus sp. AFS073361]PFP29489.1 glycosyltransferase family 1 protein [Bacillus sp. AFS073361]
MNKKMLFCATVDYHFKAFHLPYLKWFKEQGWEVHVAASGEMKLPYVDRKYNIPIQRSPFDPKNMVAYKILKSIIDNNQYKIIHCHTPMGGVLTRLAAREARRNGTKVLYTAHGFHFCKGAPFTNWMLYYPIERILSRFTDCLITINTEDYNIAKNHRFKAQEIKHVNGVGVNTDFYKPVDETHKSVLRKEHGYDTQDFLMFYAAEFNRNKNQKLLIESLALVKDEVPNAKLLLAGVGPLLQDCKELSLRLGVDGMVDFLGFRNDIDKLLMISDIAVASSLREGLPVNIMEAMACGLPVIANDNRGHRELIEDSMNGWLIRNNSEDFSKRIMTLAQAAKLRFQMGEYGRKMIFQHYSTNKVLDVQSKMYKLYMERLEEEMWATP